MIEITHGDILTADTEALVNTVNCVGVMGRGIALQFRKAFPENFRVYEAACERPDEATLEGEEPDEGYRCWPSGSC